ncbi:MAG: exodeoxyribonuclease VII large subunit [Kiritimatiellae bacterium]|nr:exodeoxyribonuclease VII large subunit [Kiritimatiellia bacterium]
MKKASGEESQLCSLSKKPTRSALDRKVHRVSDLNRKAKTILEDEIGSIWVEGEISSLRKSPQGHVYFALKDDRAEIPATLFKGHQKNQEIELRDGIQVQIYGEVSLYEVRGRYQLLCKKVEQAGLGSLHEAFEKLKERLKNEGFFDETRKRPLPLLPQRIGIVTSLTGAAIRDILQIINRRFPNIHIVIAPTRVQGDGAAQSIVHGIEWLNRHADIDVIIVGRGGGSLEDLWAFNEEMVARAITTSVVPVISAVGHEIDFTISDFVADKRAPTPSAAAELVVMRKQDFEDKIDQLKMRFTKGLQSAFYKKQQQLDESSQRVIRLMEKHVRMTTQTIHQIEYRLQGQSPQARLRLHGQRIERARSHLTRIAQGQIQKHFINIQKLTPALIHAGKNLLNERIQELAKRRTQLQALSPLSVLERGFSITTTSDDNIVRSRDQIKKGDTLKTILADGKITSEVKSI